MEYFWVITIQYDNGRTLMTISGTMVIEGTFNAMEVFNEVFSLAKENQSLRDDSVVLYYLLTPNLII